MADTIKVPMDVALEAVTKRYEERLVINRVNLHVAKGELLVLLGASGSGKSTLLRMMAGLIAPDEGKVFLGGVDATFLPPQKRNLGVVFQNYALFPHMTVSENVAFGLKVARLSPHERRKRVDGFLDMVGLSGLGERYPLQLSGGQQQRAALARALAPHPKLLLLDEPFGALDERIRSRLRDLLRGIQRDLGLTTILVTHDQDEAFELGSRIAVLERGTLMEEAPPLKLYHAPRTEFVANFIGGGNVLVGRYEHGQVRLGEHLVSLPEASPHHEEGAPVRLLFRPGSIVVRRRNEPALQTPIVLGMGHVAASTFAGPFIRYRLELENPRGVRPAVPWLPYGQRFATITGLLPHRYTDAPLGVGESVEIGFQNFHVLEPSSVRTLCVVRPHSDRQCLISTGAFIGTSTHGLLSFLCLGESDAEVQQLEDEVRATAKDANLAHPDIRKRPHGTSRYAYHEAAEGLYDLVVLNASDDRFFSDLAGRLLMQAKTPILLPQPGRERFRSILICTKGGEPGKSDVRVGARLARHTDARVVVLHVTNDSEDSVRLAKRHLDQASDLLTALQIQHETKMTGGPFPAAAAKEVRDGRHELVVVGASNVTGVLSWNRAMSIRQEIGCAVVIVPPVEP